MKPCHSSLSHFKLVSNGKNLKLLKSLSKSEATGIDKISGNFLKIATYAISPSLTYIFKNAIVSSSFFSSDLCLASNNQSNGKSIYVKVVGFVITAGDFSSKPGTLLWSRTLGTIISNFQKPTKASREHELHGHARKLRATLL